MEENIIEIQNVSKVIRQKILLENININIKAGEICGLVGRNGSGKTMLMKCICGFMHVSSGKIIVQKKEVGKQVDFPDYMGFIIETPGFFEHDKGISNLLYLASIKNRIGKEEVKKSMELVGLEWKNKLHVGKYSLGMRQRLGIAQAIMEDPDILILDEPMNGLDKDGVEDMRKLFLDLKKKGKTMIIASHSAEDIDILCDTVYEMDKGVATKIR